MEAQHARPDMYGLERLALSQGGYFDRGDALARGIGDRLLHHYIGTGRFERVFPGVYRLAIAPLSPHDDLLQAWVWSNYRGAISHESALALYELSDVLPNRVQITVPPSVRRHATAFDVHHADLYEEDTMPYEGLQVTTPARSIVDAAATGTGPEQIHMAVAQAVARGLASPAQLRTAAGRPHYRHRRRVVPLIEEALAHAHPDDASDEEASPILRLADGQRMAALQERQAHDLLTDAESDEMEQLVATYGRLLHERRVQELARK